MLPDGDFDMKAGAVTPERRGAGLQQLAWAILPPLLTAVLLFVVTEVPYAAGRRAAPPGFRSSTA